MPRPRQGRGGRRCSTAGSTNGWATFIDEMAVVGPGHGRMRSQNQCVLDSSGLWAWQKAFMSTGGRHLKRAVSCLIWESPRSATREGIHTLASLGRVFKKRVGVAGRGQNVGPANWLGGGRRLQCTLEQRSSRRLLRGCVLGRRHDSAISLLV